MPAPSQQELIEPPTAADEIRASSLPSVRKLSAFNKPSRANAEVFDRVVPEVSAAPRLLVAPIVTTAEPRDRDFEAQKARARSAERSGRDPRTSAR